MTFGRNLGANRTLIVTNVTLKKCFYQQKNKSDVGSESSFRRSLLLRRVTIVKHFRILIYVVAFTQSLIKAFPRSFCETVRLSTYCFVLMCSCS